MKKKISILQASVPLVFLICLLTYNVLYAFQDDSISGSNQFILLTSASIGIAVGLYNKVSLQRMLKGITKNIKNTAIPIIILLLVGALSGTWLISGVIPAMIYYGVQILHPSIFLCASLIISAIISLATGSSWTTSATIGIALIGISKSLGIPVEYTAGAIVSGAYLGDKMSPMSDTTTLSSSVSGSDIFTHIRYMMITTVPTFCITLIIFLIMGFNLPAQKIVANDALTTIITDNFNINLSLFLVPILVVVLVIKKVNPIIALFLGVVAAVIATLIFQHELLFKLAGNSDSFTEQYKVIVNSITKPQTIDVKLAQYKELFSSKGMSGMLTTIWLIVCAMIFGGVMESIGALKKFTSILLNMFQSVFGLFASTIISCLALNSTASDQYISILVPGKMFAKAYKKKGLAPENLSRTLEDSATVTSVLIPWNTCAAYNSGVLGVSTLEYLPYAFFNIISPFVTLFFALCNLKIRQLTKKA